MISSKDPQQRVVYSTEHGTICGGCNKPQLKCSCSKDARGAVIGNGNVRVRRETKGRGGKTVTSISGLAMSQDALTLLLKDFKRLCGTGGALKDGVLELQGEHCDQVLQELANRGIRAKRSGG